MAVTFWPSLNPSSPHGMTSYREAAGGGEPAERPTPTMEKSPSLLSLPRKALYLALLLTTTLLGVLVTMPMSYLGEGLILSGERHHNHSGSCSF